MASISEIAPDIYRLSIYVPHYNLQFNHFLIQDDEPLLFHAGFKGMFGDLHESVGRLIDPAKLRWVGFSHFESDECGALNQWLESAPMAEPVCSMVASIVNLSDFSLRPARGLNEGEAIETGKYKFRLCRTPHLPHGWDASLLFEETNKTLLCSDLFHQNGDVEARTESDIVGRTRQALTEYQTGVLADYVPFTKDTERMLHSLASMQPKTLAIMHGSTYAGNGQQALEDLAEVFREVFGDKA